VTIPRLMPNPPASTRQSRWASMSLPSSIETTLPHRETGGDEGEDVASGEAVNDVNDAVERRARESR
jgi:hypothetical protein